MRREMLFQYARKHFQSEPEYLWRNFPDYAVLRHHEGNKWFGIVMNVPGTKLGLTADDEVDILNVKIRPESIIALRKMDGILPAYHMNKEHWVSILLVSSLPAQEIYDLLTDSYELTS